MFGRRFIHHFVWWFLALVLVPLALVALAAVTESTPTDVMALTAFTLLIYPMSVVLGFPELEPMLNALPKVKSLLAVILVFWGAVCLLLAAGTSTLANYLAKRRNAGVIGRRCDP
jgi:hypothetical protein